MARKGCDLTVLMQGRTCQADELVLSSCHLDHRLGMFLRSRVIHITWLCSHFSKLTQMLQQTMKNRHLNMIAVGGSIGTGLFMCVCSFTAPRRTGS